jgi:hypothetical protein
VLQYFEGDDNVKRLGGETQTPPFADISDNRRRRVCVDADDAANSAVPQISSGPSVSTADLQYQVVRRDCVEEIPLL